MSLKASLVTVALSLMCTAAFADGIASGADSGEPSQLSLKSDLFVCQTAAIIKKADDSSAVSCPTKSTNASEPCTCPVPDSNQVAKGVVADLKAAPLAVSFRIYPDAKVDSQDKFEQFSATAGSRYEQFVEAAKKMGWNISVSEEDFPTNGEFQIKKGDTLQSLMEKYESPLPFCRPVDDDCEQDIKDRNRWGKNADVKLNQLKQGTFEGTVELPVKGEDKVVTILSGAGVLKSARNEISHAHYVTTVQVSKALYDVIGQYKPSVADFGGFYSDGRDSAGNDVGNLDYGNVLIADPK